MNGNVFKPLSGKVALVTGSTSGIGLGIAKALASNGADIVLNGFGDVGAAVDAIGAYQVRVLHHNADMTQPADIEAMMLAAGEFGGVDILVNNAGIQFVADVEDLPPSKWDEIIAINLSSSFHTMRLAIPQMRERGWGRIINIASVHGFVGSIGKSAYVAAKHGIIGLTKVVALENAQSGVTANAICPGFVLTPLVQRQVEALAERDSIPEDEARGKLLGPKQPSRHFVEAEQIGATAVFLCSEAASEMRGSTIQIDGGWTAQ
jgi:3-hydroxybutyrate dehydrogenase